MTSALHEKTKLQHERKEERRGSRDQKGELAGIAVELCRDEFVSERRRRIKHDGEKGKEHFITSETSSILPS